MRIAPTLIPIAALVEGEAAVRFKSKTIMHRHTMSDIHPKDCTVADDGAAQKSPHHWRAPRWGQRWGARKQEKKNREFTA
jgi:hypothetical protein